MLVTSMTENISQQLDKAICFLQRKTSCLIILLSDTSIKSVSIPLWSMKKSYLKLQSKRLWILVSSYYYKYFLVLFSFKKLSELTGYQLQVVKKII